MKRRWAWRWTITYAGSRTHWYGTCPVWAAQPLPAGAEITKERMLTVGPLEGCAVPGCGSGHPVVAAPEWLR